MQTFALDFTGLFYAAWLLYSMISSVPAWLILQCGLQDTQTSPAPWGCSCHPMVDAAPQGGANR